MPSRPTPRLLFILHVVALFSAVTLEGAPKAARFDELLSHYQKAGFLNGVVLVAEHGKIIYVKGFGEADMNAHAPNNRKTKFDIASLTKRARAVSRAVLMLYASS